MKFAVKVHCYELNNSRKPYAVYFFGKDGFVHSDTLLLEGWKQKRFAEAFIKRDIENSPNTWKLCEHVGVENNRWINFYEIIEIDD